MKGGGWKDGDVVDQKLEYWLTLPQPMSKAEALESQ